MAELASRESTRFFMSDRGALAYEVNGHGPWVALCHALITDRRIWSSQVLALSDHRSVLTFDLRGHGQSLPAADGCYTFEAMTNDVVDLLDHLHIDRAAVVGISVGGEIAQMLAARQPDRVSQLFLASTACFTDAVRAAMWQSRIDTALSQGMESVADSAVKRWFSKQFASIRPDVIETWKHIIAATSVEAYVAIVQTIQEMDLRPLLRDIACETHIVCGSLDENTGPPVAAQLAELITGSRLFVIEGTGHFPNVEDPKAFNRCLMHWLRQPSLEADQMSVDQA